MAKVNKPRGLKGEESVHRVRALFLRALDIVGERGKSPAAILADQYEANSLGFMEKWIRALPKDMNISQQSTITLVDLISEFAKARSAHLPVDKSALEVEHTLTH